MRYLLLSSAVLLAAAATAVAADTPTHTVFLNSVVLEDIRTADPPRYAEIQKVMAAASEMCKPNAARSWTVKSAPAADCSALVLKTSFPPKRQIDFTIGDTRYIANVIVRDAPALAKAEPGKVTPADSEPSK